MKRPYLILPALALLIFPALLLMAGCEDPLPLTPEEQKIVVGALPNAVCPRAENDYLAPSTVQATIFGIDGAVAGGVNVVFSTTAGQFEESIVPTDELNGRALAVLPVPRVPGGTVVTVTGTLESTGETDTVEILSPILPDAILDAPFETYEVRTDENDSLVTLFFSTAWTCDISEIRFAMTYDPLVVEIAPIREGGVPVEPWTLDIQESGALNNGDIPTDLVFVHQPGRLEIVHYRRTDDPLTGYTSYGGGHVGLLSIAFDPLAEGDAGFAVESIELLPSDGGPPWEIALEDFVADQVTIVPAASGS